MLKDRNGGFRIYEQNGNASNPKEGASERLIFQEADLQVAMIQKVHIKTKLFALLVFKGDIKGIRYYDGAKQAFIDIAPWQIQYFNISGMRVIGVRELELIKVDNEKHNQTEVIQHLTQHEIKEYYRPNRMTPNDLAKALSYIMDYIDDVEYENIMGQLRTS